MGEFGVAAHPTDDDGAVIGGVVEGLGGVVVAFLLFESGGGVFELFAIEAADFVVEGGIVDEGVGF